jgi:hypothetical protein
MRYFVGLHCLLLLDTTTLSYLSSFSYFRSTHSKRNDDSSFSWQFILEGDMNANATAAANNRVLLEVMIITIHTVQKGTERLCKERTKCKD